MSLKRKYTGSSRYGKRRRMGYRARRPARRFVRRRRRTFKKRYRQQRNRNVVGSSIMRQIHIPMVKKTSPFYRRVGTIAGSPKYIRWHTNITSSGLTDKRTLGLRLEATMSSYTLKGPWETSNRTAYGAPSQINGTSGDVPQLFPICKEILIRYIRVKFTFNIKAENLRIRICLAKRKTRQHTTDDWKMLWNPDIDEFQNKSLWKVMNTKFINNSTETVTYTGEATLETTHTSRIVTRSFFFPINRVFRTSTGMTAKLAADWIGDAQDSQYTYMFIDTDDKTWLDGEHCDVRVDYEAVYEEIN
jgi:hypothetical protein